jgi:hypothetical protein
MWSLIHQIVLAAENIGPQPVSGPPSAIDNLRLIVSKPDNIPILLMIILVGFYTGMAMRDARKHDRLIREGRKNEILRTMQD